MSLKWQEDSIFSLASTTHNLKFATIEGAFSWSVFSSE